MASPQSTTRRGNTSARRPACRRCSTWSGFVLAGWRDPAASARPSSRSDTSDATLRADQVWCQLFSEPGAGSDLGGLTHAGRARRRPVHRQRPEGVVQRRALQQLGHPHGPHRTPTSPKHKGISFFLLPMDLPGVEVRPLRQMTGEAEFDEVFFTDVALPGRPPARPAARRLGRRHGGAHQRAWPHRHEHHRPRAAAGGDGSARRRPRARRRSQRQRLARLMSTGIGLQGDGSTPGTDRVHGGVADEARHHRDDVRVGDAARRPRRRRRMLDGSRGRLACWPRPAAASPAAPARCSATSSASACSDCRVRAETSGCMIGARCG